MRKPEQRLWDRMRNALGAQLRLERIENLVSVGMPDVLAIKQQRVSFVELKAQAEWPARATTSVLGREGLSVDQRNWLLDWRSHGGTAWVLVSVGKEHFLFDAKHADTLNTFTQEQLRALAAATGWEEIGRALGS